MFTWVVLISASVCIFTSIFTHTYYVDQDFSHIIDLYLSTIYTRVLVYSMQWKDIELRGADIRRYGRLISGVITHRSQLYNHVSRR